MQETKSPDPQGTDNAVAVQVGMAGENAVMIARQPIFDRASAVFGYELLFRSSAQNQYTGVDPKVASAETISRAMHWMGLETVVGEKKAFINFTMQLMLEEMHLVLPKERCVLEVLETTHADPEAVAICRQAKDLGYEFALDDVTDLSTAGPLLELADYIKLDFRGITPVRRALVIGEAVRRGCKVLAEKVETREEFAQAMDCGCHLVQGYFFCRPQMVVSKALHGSQVVYMEFLRELNRQQLQFERLEHIIKREPSLAFKLLRYLNSASMGMRNKVTSIRQALVLLGEKAVRKWGTLAVLTNANHGRPSELLVSSLVRANFCERLANAMGAAEKSLDLFLVGLLSMIDAVMDSSMEQVLKQTAVSDAVRSVLLNEPTAPRDLALVFLLAKACERGAWNTVVEASTSLRLTQSEIAVLFYESIGWAEQMMELAR